MMKAPRGLLSVATGLNAKHAFATFVLGIASAVAAAVQDAAMDPATMNHALVDSAPVNAAVGEASAMGEAMGDMPAHGSATHGNHNPKFGGLVLMYGLLHFEIVGRPEGGVELHMSDAMRVPMPAVTVSDVTVEIEREDGAFETVTMSISEAGDFWSGPCAPLTDQENTTVHFAFVAFGVPYVYALPLGALRPDESAGVLNVNAETASVAVWTPPRAG